MSFPATCPACVFLMTASRNPTDVLVVISRERAVYGSDQWQTKFVERCTNAISGFSERRMLIRIKMQYQTISDKRYMTIITHAMYELNSISFPSIINKDSFPVRNHDYGNITC